MVVEGKLADILLWFRSFVKALEALLFPFFFLPLLAFVWAGSSRVGEWPPRFLKKPSLLREPLLKEELPSDKLLTERCFGGLAVCLWAGLIVFLFPELKFELEIVDFVTRLLFWPGNLA